MLQQFMHHATCLTVMNMNSIQVHFHANIITNIGTLIIHNVQIVIPLSHYRCFV